MKNVKFTIVIEKDPTIGFFIGYVPGMTGAHSQGETVEELKSNLKDAIELCVQEGDPFIVSEYVGTDQLEVTI
jgi:predicted RNase H-like HicB family nuclease